MFFFFPHSTVTKIMSPPLYYCLLTLVILIDIVRVHSLPRDGIYLGMNSSVTERIESQPWNERSIHSLNKYQYTKSLPLVYPIILLIFMCIYITYFFIFHSFFSIDFCIIYVYTLDQIVFFFDTTDDLT